jgi:uncharacterized protein
MKTITLLQSHKGNKYFYDGKMKSTQLCHPLLHYIINSSNKGIDIRGWLDGLEDDPVEIENAGRFSKQEISYYYRKYLILKENGYFGEIDQNRRLSADIKPLDIKKVLANLKQLTFETTENCNLDCYYCGYGKFYDNYDKRKQENLDIRSAKRLLDYFRELWNSPLNRSHDRNIHISFYGGEPLLNFPFIKEIVDYMHHMDVLHNRFTFTMTTNGILIEKYMDFLYEHNFDLLVSLDGNEENNAYRVFKNGKPAYAAILNNVEALRKRYPDYFLNRVNFNAVLHNKNSVSDIYHFFKRHSNKIPVIGELNTIGLKDSREAEFLETCANIEESLYQSEDYSTIAKDMFNNLPTVSEVSSFLLYNNDCCFDNYNDLAYSSNGEIRIPTGTCFPFSKRVFVTTKGKLLPCETIGHRYQLGRVTPDRVELDFEKIAEKYNAYFKKMRKLCNTCRRAENCIQCLYYLDIEDESPVCKGFMNPKDYAGYVSSIISYIEKNSGAYSKILAEAFGD